MKHNTYIFLLIGYFFPLASGAQTPDSIYSPVIKTPQLFMAGNQLGYPILRLNSTDQLELHFDDLDADVKNYSYTFQLCNQDWTPAEVSEFDYIKGFSQVRISNYQYSSLALTHYTHYQAVLPDQSSIPIHSGNYLLKVFLDGDTSRLAFTRRFLVTDVKTNIHAQLLEPMSFELSHTHQRIQLKVNTAGVNPNNALDQIKVVVLQNTRWDNTIHDIKPTFYINNNLEYNQDDICLFPGGNEWRWVDLQSFRYQSERVQTANYGKTSTEVILKPDADRSQKQYYFYKDYNGFYFIQTTESINTLYQTDYATVKFSFVPPGNAAFPDKDVYVFGKCNGEGMNDSTRMVFNTERGRYEASFLLKQGYYSYCYVTADRADPDRKASFEFTEGNHLETENDYMVLVYYRALGSRADELVGISRFNSLNK
jgi:Domain of unknown function (DUF5103)